MIQDLAYTNKGFYTFNQVKSKLIYLLDLEATGLYIKKLSSF